MAQPTSDQLKRIIDDAAMSVEAGLPLNDIARFQAAGSAVKLANDEGRTEELDVFILIAGGKYAAAASALMNLALAESGTDASSFDPLAGVDFGAQPADATPPSATTTGDATKPPSRGRRTGATKPTGK